MYFVMHPPPIRDTGGDWWGLGINHDLHVNFDTRGGAFDLSPHNLCHEVNENGCEESFGVLAVFGRTRKGTFIGGRKELHTEILMSSEGRKFTCRRIFLKVASSLFL